MGADMQTDRGVPGRRRCCWRWTFGCGAVRCRWAKVRGPAYIRGASSQPQRDIGRGGHGPGDWGGRGSRVVRGRGRGERVCLWWGSCLLVPRSDVYDAPCMLLRSSGTYSIDPTSTTVSRAACSTTRACHSTSECTWLECVPGRHLSSHIMSPQRRVKQKQSKVQSLVSHPRLLPPAYRPPPRRPQDNRRPSDRLPKQWPMKLHCCWVRRQAIFLRPWPVLAGWLCGTGSSGWTQGFGSVGAGRPASRTGILARCQILPTATTGTACGAPSADPARSMAHRGLSVASAPLFFKVSLA